MGIDSARQLTPGRFLIKRFLMKTGKLLALGLVCIGWGAEDASAQSEARVFTSQDGKKIEAKMVAFQSETAHVEMGGRNFSIPLEKLSAEDQDWVREWAKKNTNYRLDFSVRGVEDTRARRSERKRDEKERKESWEWETWGYQLAVGNRSGIDLSELTVN